MSKLLTGIGAGLSFCLLLAGNGVLAQSPADTTAAFKPGGKIWGYAFGDYAYKDHADSVGSGTTKFSKGRGGGNQYTNMPPNTSMFQFRRIYLGYNYDISPKFSAEFVLAAEDNFNGGLDNQGAGDVMQDGKFAPYVKIANLRWKNIWKGTDLVVGQSNTPAFAKQGPNNQTAEEVWGYRSIERTITDIRRTPSFDMGVSLQGHLPNNDNYGYALMVGNGQAARVENDNFKWFYGDVFAKFLNKKLVVDLYADYQKMIWNTGWHNDRQMTKLFVAYTVPKYSIGVEAFMNRVMGDVFAAKNTGGIDTLTAQATGISVFAKGRIYKDKLGFFARYDMYNPAGNIDDNKYRTYTEQRVAQYDVNNKENFITAGLDFTPMKNVHIMPNIWYNSYSNTAPYTDAKPNDYDMVYRITFYYTYGK